MERKISIIVSIYNVEKYIYKCVDSLRNQTYTNLEIILVNDESPDNCPEICENYKKMDNRIKVIHKKNGGLSDARNFGLEEASGDYVIFIDGDDFVEERMAEKAIAIAETTQSDIVQWGFFVDFVNNQEEIIRSKVHSQPQAIYIKKQFKIIEVNKNFLGDLGYAWNKMYKKKFLEDNDLKFKKGLLLVEDIVFNSEAFSNCNIIAFIEDPLLHYMQRPRETLGNKFYNNYFELKAESLKSIKNLLSIWEIDDKKTKVLISEIGFSVLKNSVKMVSLAHDFTTKEKKRYISQLLEDPRAKVILNNFQAHKIKDYIIHQLMNLRQSHLLLQVYKIK